MLNLTAVTSSNKDLFRGVINVIFLNILK